MRAFKRYKINTGERPGIVGKITACLEKEDAVLIAYIYGSFREEEGFNDIDVAVFVDETAIKKDAMIDYQLGLAVRLERDIKSFPVDCRALNIAPLSFRFSVINRGDIIYSRDEKKRVSFEVTTRSLYFDFKPHAQFYFENAVHGA